MYFRQLRQKNTLHDRSIENVTESVLIRERILDDCSEQVTESSEDSLPCGVGQEESQQVNITLDRWEPMVPP